MCKKNILLVIYAFLILINMSPAHAAVPVPVPVPVPGNDAGAINVHAMNLLKQREQTIREDRDFIEVKQKQQTQQEENIETKGIESKAPVVKATVEEYETKGVYIEKVEFSPSKILSAAELETFISKLTNKNLFMNDIHEVINQINNLYYEKGFVTARANLSEQTIENGTLKIDLIEGTIGKLNLREHKWTRDYYIRQRISQKSGDLFRIPQLEQDILKFNRYNEEVKLNANLTAGELFGTTDINITAEEKFPFHITGLFDNAGRSTIGVLRGGVMVVDDSLFGLRDKLTSGVYLSKNSTTPFVDYNIPVNKRDGRIGFSFSSSFAEIANGDYEMFDITSRSFNYTLYYTQPVIRKPNFELVSTSSLFYKQATTVFAGQDLSTDKIASVQTGLMARYDTKHGIWYAGQSAYQAFPIFSDASRYFKYEGDFIRLHDFGHSIVGQVRAMYQWSPKDVMPYIDQFQAGGLSTTRGYTEGLLIGRTGYLFSAELLFPIAPQKINITKHKKVPFIGKIVRGALFVDHAGTFPFKGRGPGKQGVTANDFLVSVGPGLRIQLPADLTARLYWGFACLNNSHGPKTRASRFHFELSLSPDFDRLLKLRKSRKEAL